MSRRSTTTSPSCCSSAGATSRRSWSSTPPRASIPRTGRRGFLRHDLVTLGRYRDARAALERAVRLMPREVDASLQLAAVCQRLDDRICVANAYRHVTQLAPDDAEYAYRLGSAQLEVSEWAYARLRERHPKSAACSRRWGASTCSRVAPTRRSMRFSARSTPIQYSRSPPGAGAHPSGRRARGRRVARDCPRVGDRSVRKGRAGAQGAHRAQRAAAGEGCRRRRSASPAPLVRRRRHRCGHRRAAMGRRGAWARRRHRAGAAGGTSSC